MASDPTYAFSGSAGIGQGAVNTYNTSTPTTTSTVRDASPSYAFSGSAGVGSGQPASSYVAPGNIPSTSAATPPATSTGATLYLADGSGYNQATGQQVVPPTSTPTTPTNQTTNVPAATLTPTQQGLQTALSSGITPPQTAAAAQSAINGITAANGAGSTPTTPSFYKPTTPVPGYNPQTVFDANGKPLSYDQFIAAGGKSDFSNVKSGNPPAQSAAETSQTPVSNTVHTPTSIQQALENDPGYQKLLTDAKNIQSSATQSQTLQSQYQQLLTQYNIPNIDTTLINDQAIINGTEQDIRNEVTKAGGFATNSQVLGLATARNKTIIDNYNQLLATKNDAMTQINTMIGLAGQDKTFAMNAANSQLNIDQQLADYQQKFTTNAQAGYNNVIQAVGYSGLYNSILSTSGTNGVALAEQTLNLPPGSLSQIAASPNPAAQLQAVQLAQAKLNLQQSTAEEPLKVKQLQAQINSSNASAASSAASTAKTQAETAFENSHGGQTETEYNTQQQKQANDENTQVQGFQKDAGTFITQLDTGKITWGAAWNALHAQYPQASTETIDNALDATNYRNSAHGG